MIAWLALNIVWASAAMLLVLALRQPAARLFGAGIAYALWLVPALRLIQPPLPAWHGAIPSVASPETLVVFVEGTAAPLPPDGGPGQWVPILLAIWAGGAAAFILWQWLAYRAFLARISRGARRICAHRGLPIVASEGAEGPLALGLVERRIVVPADFETRYAPTERVLALDHEAVHHRRGDLWWNLAALLVLALNWFNPIAWIAFRAFRADQELACDAAVTAGADSTVRHAYASALIKSASRPGLIAACPLNHADQLKRRLRMMKEHRRNRARLPGGLAILGLVTAIGLTTGASVTAQPQAEPPAPPHVSGGDHPRERVIVRTVTRDGRSETTTERIEGDGSGVPAEGTRRNERVILISPGARAQAGATGQSEGGTRVHTRMAVRHCEDSRDDAARTGETDRRVVVLCRSGEGGGARPTAMVTGCSDADRFEVNEGTDRDRYRFVLCSTGANESPARRAQTLQQVRDRLAGDAGDLTGERRTRVLAAIDREIARLRGN